MQERRSKLKEDGNAMDEGNFPKPIDELDCNSEMESRNMMSNRRRMKSHHMIGN